VVFLEHKLLSKQWLDAMGGDRRDSVAFDIPAAGRQGSVPDPPRSVPLGSANVVRRGGDVTLVSLGVGLHRCLEAADRLAQDGIEATVIDLRSVAPLDGETVVDSARRTGRVVMVDEDYVRGGLSGEIAALLAEAEVPARYVRVTTTDTIPYARHLEDQMLPSTQRIVEAVGRLS
jgi:pyruvate dehydrogenase E1 component beta subunit